MNASQDLHRRLARHYETEPPTRAPDWVLHSALSTIESTPQRRGLAALRRYPSMPTYVKFAAAAALVIAVGGFAVWQLAPGGGGASNPTPSPASTAIPTPRPTRTASPTAPAPTTYVVPQLTGTFESPLYGFSLSYPQGWGTQAATELWEVGAVPEFGDPAVDTIYDVGLEDHLFVGAGSQLLKGGTLLDWQGDFLTAEKCGGTDPIVIDGANGVIGRNCDIAVVEAGGRGYVFGLWSSGDDPQLLGLDTRGLFQQVLATVQLRPEDAVE